MPKFFDLCSDSLWGIRKACAECFMMVSNSTSPEVRRSKLSPLFISLISDQSRWVRYTNTRGQRGKELGNGRKGGGDFVKITITIKCNVLSGVMKLGQLLLGAILHPSSLFSMRYACNLSDFQTGTWNQSVVLLMCLKLRAEYTFSSV